MANPVSAAVAVTKSNLSFGRVLGFMVAGVAAFAILDVFGVTDWLLYPVSKARAYYAKAKAGA